MLKACAKQPSDAPVAAHILQSPPFNRVPSHNVLMRKYCI